MSLSWTDSALSERELAHRMRMLDKKREGMTIGFFRVWQNYLWTPMQRVGLSYSSRWTHLRPGKSYLVVFRDAEGARGAVMRFERYVKVPQMVISQRLSAVRARLDAIRVEKAYFCESQSDESEYDSEAEEEARWDARYDLHAAVVAIKKEWAMEQYELHFRNLRHHGVYVIDPCAEDRGCLEIFDIGSNGWTACRDMYISGVGNVRSDQAKAVQRLDGIRRGWARGILREWAAIRIQRAWRKAVATPSYALCEKRLRSEFEEANDVLMCKKSK